MPWPLYLALKQLLSSGWIVRFITLITIVGVTLGVAAMLLTTSIMGGWGRQFEAMMVETQGEITVASNRIITDEQRIADLIMSVPEVEAASPYAKGYVMIEHRNVPAFPEMRSVNPEKLGVTIPLDKYLLDGKLEDLDDDSIILSVKLAQTLGAWVGSTVSVYSPAMMERIKANEILLPRELRVVGIFQVGHQHLDTSVVIGTMRLMQDLYNLESGIHGFNVRLKPDADLFEATRKLKAVLPPGVFAYTWIETNADFQSVLSFERSIMLFMLAFIVVVASFAIMSALLLTVIHKTREIGLIGALGGSAGGVAACFCLRGLVMGGSGVIAGLIVGFTVLHFRNGIVRVLSDLTMGRDNFSEFYLFTELPAHTEMSELVSIVVFTLIASMLAGLIPAWLAGRMKPVEALRSE